MPTTFKITAAQVKELVNWDINTDAPLHQNYGNTNVRIEYGDNVIYARWTDTDDAQLTHTRFWRLSDIFQTNEYKDFLGLNENAFYTRIADALDDYFSENPTIEDSPLPLGNNEDN